MQKGLKTGFNKGLLKMAKKKFYPVYVKDLWQDEVCSVLSPSLESLIGKDLKLSLSDFVRAKRGDILVKVDKVEDGKAFASIFGLRLFFSYIRRFVRKGVTKIDMSFNVGVKEGNVRIKLLLVTRKKVKSSVEKALRIETVKFAEKSFGGEKGKEVVLSVLRSDFQKKLGVKLKKIYPLALCEIREVRFVEGVKDEEVSVKAESAKEEKLVSVKAGEGSAAKKVEKKVERKEVSDKAKSAEGVEEVKKIEKGVKEVEKKEVSAKVKSAKGAKEKEVKELKEVKEVKKAVKKDVKKKKSKEVK